MESPEGITGKNMLKLIYQLKKEKTILKFNILGTGNEYLSIFLGTKTINEKPCLVIDFPAGEKNDIFYAQGKKAIIEFTDRKKIHYNLRSVIADVSEQNICVLMPDVVYRIQRRKFFRIAPPVGTKVIVDDKDEKFEFNVINISEGGTLISHPTIFHDDKKFYKGAFKTLMLDCNQNNITQTIRINKAEIKRIEKNMETGRCHYAMQFIDCGIKEENDIRNFIYSCQRRLLKNRLSPEAD